MLTELQEKWLQALESGEYEQCREYLSEDGKYCCLGVACEVMIKHGIPITKEQKDNVILYDGLKTQLVEYQKLGLRNPRGLIRGTDENLMFLNDVKQWTFKEIATFIRNNPERVFYVD